MDAIYTKLMARARAKHGYILPVKGDQLSSGCVCQDGFVQFWFNTPDHSTHLLFEPLTGAS